MNDQLPAGLISQLPKAVHRYGRVMGQGVLHKEDLLIELLS